MLIKIHSEHPSERKMDQVIETLEKGGVIIYPTDTVYGLGCDIFNRKAVERIAQLKGVDPKKANFSFICYDLSHMSDFITSIDNETFKLIKNNTPGAFTFILPANNKVPKLFQSRKKTVGIRVPDNPIALEIVRRLGHPIMTTSILDDDEVLEYSTNPELIHDKYEKQVDMVIDGGAGGNVPSTVIDCTGEEPEIVRMGKGKL
jgi:tRNA threonylcarbamoyl adenosine modification protein (Sua5/YciO/YrdC/YwlC family)